MNATVAIGHVPLPAGQTVTEQAWESAEIKAHQMAERVRRRFPALNLLSESDRLNDDDGCRVRVRLRRPTYHCTNGEAGPCLKCGLWLAAHVQAEDEPDVFLCP